MLVIGGALRGGGAEARIRMIGKHLFDGTADIAVFLGNAKGVHFDNHRLVDLQWKGDFSYARMLVRLRKLLIRRRYGAILSIGFNPSLVAWASTRYLPSRPAIIATENTRPSTANTLYARALRRWFIQRASRWVYQSADLCAANSEDGVIEMTKDFGVPSERVRRIPNLIEPERIRELANKHTPANDKRSMSLCFVGRLVRMKRVETLLAAAADIVDRADWQLDIIGQGPMEQELRQLTVKQGIAHRTMFHGWLENPYAYMLRASAVIICSELEGFSNTALEAMVLGTPVITSLCSHDSAQMCAAGAALGFPVGDHVRLSHHLRSVLSDETLRSQVSKAAYTYAQRHVLPDAIREYESLTMDAIAIHRWNSK